MQPADFETGLHQLGSKLFECVTSKMTEVLVDRRVDLRACRDEQAQGTLPCLQQLRVELKLARIVTNMFEDIDAENSVPTLAGRKIARGAVNDLMLREFFLMLRTKSRLRFDGHNAPNLVKPD